MINLFRPPTVDEHKIIENNTKYIKTNRGYRIPFLISKSDNRGGNNNDTKIIIYSHGCLSDIYTELPFINRFAELTGYSVLAYDYCGYGIHQLDDSVKINEENMALDLQSIIDYIVCENNIPIKNVFLLGKSLGNGPSIKVASCLPSLGGIILISPFTSINGIIVGPDMPFIEGSDTFNNKDGVKNIGCPMFFTHCKNNLEIPFKHSLILHQSAVLSYGNVYNYWETDCGNEDEGDDVTNKMLDMISNFIHSN